MTSETQICNFALSSIGTRSTIAALTEDSNEARACNLWFAQTRDDMLQQAFWNFARKTATLSLLKQAPGTPGFSGTQSTTWNSSYPAPPWLYEYAYPSDCLQLQYLLPQITTGWTGDVPLFGADVITSGPIWNSPAVPFAIGSDTDAGGNDITVILTSQYQAIGVYNRRITNPSLFSSQFVSAFQCLLAARIAIALTGDKQLANGMINQANGLILQARVADGDEGLTVQDPPTDWIQARENGGFGANAWLVSPYPPLFSSF